MPRPKGSKNKNTNQNIIEKENISQSFQEEIEIVSKEDIKISKIDDTYIITDFEKFEKSSYNIDKINHQYSKYLTYDDELGTVLTTDLLNELSRNPQNNLDKIKQVNSIAKIYINKDDLTGKVYETIENNVNTENQLIFPDVEGRNKLKLKDKAVGLINDFNECISLSSFLKKSVTTTYSEGTYICYLRNTTDKDKNYTIDYYPLGIALISDYEIDGEPVVVIDINELKTRLTNIGFKDKSGKNLIKGFPTIDDEIKKNYPQEVYQAYLSKERYAILNQERVGIVRINNLNGRYGLTPIFRTFSAQLMLDTIERTDQKNTAAKGKKIIHQSLSDKLLGNDGNNTKHFAEINYAHKNLLKGWSMPIVLLTTAGYVDDIKYVEPSTEQTNVQNINYYRNKVLTALGISFLSNESKSSFNAVQVNIDELKKTVNKIVNQVEDILKKYYYIVLRDNGIKDKQFMPQIKIINSELMDIELKIKLADILFSKIGVSYKTTLELLGYNFNEEVDRRKNENEEKMDEDVFIPHASSYTTSSKDIINKNTDKTEENTNKNTDEKDYDQERYKNQQ